MYMYVLHSQGQHFYHSVTITRKFSLDVLGTFMLTIILYKTTGEAQSLGVEAKLNLLLCAPT